MPVLTSPRRSFAKPLLIFCGLALVVGFGAQAYLQRQTRQLAPSGYLLALDATSKASTGWGRHTVATALSVLPGQTVKIPSGSHFKLVQAEGRVKTISGPALVQLPPPNPPEEIDFFRSPFSAVLVNAKIDPALINDKIRLTSPVGVTRFLNPTIAWQAREKIDYDVAVRDPSDEMMPVRLAHAVRPPIELARLETPQNHQLIADRIYEVVVRETGSQTAIGGARVLTEPDATTDLLPTSPAELLIEAAMAMAKKPTRTGDAWLALSRLPPAWAETELSLRLRLQVAHELGLTDEIAQIAAQAKR